MPVIATILDRVWRIIPAQIRALMPGDSILRRFGRRLRAPALPHDAVYTHAYFSELEVTALAFAAAIATSILNRFHPRSVLDVGMRDGRPSRGLAQAGRANLGFGACRGGESNVSHPRH